ncbi:hypothetical protein M0R45_002126 [Rubus argutus]|uniref:3'-5' exonuclease n=1 Tax=Rubus argutus TaxID=59490 RepID=A0AAW1VH99_RUBAR
MGYPTMTFEGQITYSRTAVEVEKAAMEVLKTLEAKKNEMDKNAVGFDIEWKPTFKRGVPPGKVAVLQICVDTSCQVMHIIHSGIPQSLQLLLESSSILKVGVGIANDAAKFFKDYNVSIKAVEDLSYLANQKLCGDTQNWGLASLTEKLICKQLLKPKKIRLGNWETKYLSKEQLQYAATDAFASWYLYEVLRSLPDVENLEKVTAANQSRATEILFDYLSLLCNLDKGSLQAIMTVFVTGVGGRLKSMVVVTTLWESVTMALGYIAWCEGLVAVTTPPRAFWHRGALE